MNYIDVGHTLPVPFNMVPSTSVPDVVPSAGQHGPQYVMVPDVVPSVGQHGPQHVSP